MIKNPEKWEAWERDYKRSQPHGVQRNLKIADDLFDHARKMGALHRDDPLEGLETIIRIARIVNGHRSSD